MKNAGIYLVYMQSSAARPQGGDRNWCNRLRGDAACGCVSRLLGKFSSEDRFYVLIGGHLAAVKIPGEINRHAAFDLAWRTGVSPVQPGGDARPPLARPHMLPWRN
jgi:hypothetical protein